MKRRISLLLAETLREREGFANEREVSSRLCATLAAAVLFGGSLRIKNRQDIAPTRFTLEKIERNGRLIYAAKI